MSIHGSFAYAPAVNRQAIDLVAANPAAFAPIAIATFGLSLIAEAFEAAKDSKKQVKGLIGHAK